jgi:Vacuolar protein sorting-associated protein 35
VFTHEFHLHSLRPFFATAQLHPKVNIKVIVIALIDGLAAYAARTAYSKGPEATKKQEKVTAKRLAASGVSKGAQKEKNEVFVGCPALLETSRRTHQGAY